MTQQPYFQIKFWLLYSERGCSGLSRISLMAPFSNVCFHWRFFEDPFSSGEEAPFNCATLWTKGLSYVISQNLHQSLSEKWLNVLGRCFCYSYKTRMTWQSIKARISLTNSSLTILLQISVIFKLKFHSRFNSLQSDVVIHLFEAVDSQHICKESRVKQ